MQSRHAPSGHPACVQAHVSRPPPPPPAPPRPASAVTLRPASLACLTPHRLLGSLTPLHRNNRVAQCFESKIPPPGFFSAAPPGLEQRLSARPTPHSPAPPHRSFPAPPARQDKPAAHCAAPAIRLPRGPTTPRWARSAPPTLPSPLPRARTVGLKDPTKTECPLITKFSPPVLAAAGTRRCSAAWTHQKTTTAKH